MIDSAIYDRNQMRVIGNEVSFSMLFGEIIGFKDKKICSYSTDGIFPLAYSNKLLAYSGPKKGQIHKVESMDVSYSLPVFEIAANPRIDLTEPGKERLASVETLEVKGRAAIAKELRRVCKKIRNEYGHDVIIVKIYRSKDIIIPYYDGEGNFCFVIRSELGIFVVDKFVPIAEPEFEERIRRSKEEAVTA